MDYPFEVIIGLEVHVQLMTDSKLFCGDGTKFGEPPNTLVSPISIGMPGVLPVMNKRALDLAISAESNTNGADIKRVVPRIFEDDEGGADQPVAGAGQGHGPEHPPGIGAQRIRRGQPVEMGDVDAAVRLAGASDRDGDGLKDDVDKCPDDPEDKDGFEDDDGCPDPDNDHDRILDKDDKCPNEPETYNGFEDEDGCPDRGRVVVTRPSYPVVQPIVKPQTPARGRSA